MAVARGVAEAASETESGVLMTMRVNTIITHCRPEDAYTLIEFLDQLRDMLMESYGNEMKTMLQEASQREPSDKDTNDEGF